MNPPYSQHLKEAFVDKAIEESRKGKVSVLLLPVSTSTKLFHEKILPNAREIRFLKGRVKFVEFEAEGKSTKQGTPMHDSMIVVIAPDCGSLDLLSFSPAKSSAPLIQFG